MNIRLGKISQLLFPSYSNCRRCDTTWNLVEPHSVYYSDHQGCFALCEKCWNDCDPLTRMGFYLEFKYRITDEQFKTLRKNIIGHLMADPH